MKIIAHAPSRISLFGGGTDLSPFCEEYGGKVLNMAINLRHKCVLEPSPIPGHLWYLISAMGEIREGSINDLPKRGVDKKFGLIYEIIRSYDLPNGFRFADEFDGIQSAGLGSSASAAVSMIGAFNRWLGIKQSRQEVAEKAWQMEINLGWVSGKQDQYASAFGGVNFFAFNEKVYNDPIERGAVEKFLPWCLLVYTGATRHSAEIQAVLRKRMKGKKTIKALKKLRALAWESREHLRSGDYQKVGEMLDESWEWKKQSNPKATSPRIDKFYQEAMEAGAIGGKVLGAGQEGHMLFVVAPRQREAVLKALALKEIDFSICWNGLEVREDYQ